MFSANCKEHICEGFMAFRDRLQMVEYFFYDEADAFAWHARNCKCLPEDYLLMVPISFNVLYQRLVARTRWTCECSRRRSDGSDSMEGKKMKRRRVNDEQHEEAACPEF